ncbi:hypothetical protein FO519_000413 [Halicephalobus sp. NKZ332]|nr:hypothetical protein FO519_000413 [Halicephalobus sp. NKZ332]
MAGTTGRVTKAGADALTRYVAPVVSTSQDEARRRVLSIYKEVQRLAPKFWFEYDLREISLPALRTVLKKQFTKNAHLSDIRAIDRRVGETHEHLENIRMYYYNRDHVRNMLFHENIEPQPKDFLSRFLSRKD